MTDERSKPDRSDIDPWGTIEAIRADPRFPPHKREEIEDIHATFERVGSAVADNEAVMDAMRLAFAYGTIIGSYVSTGDPALLEKINSVQGSYAGTISGNRRQNRWWHEPALELARVYRNSHPKWSQERLADEVVRQLRSDFSNNKVVGTETMKDFISKSEREGRLPSRRNLGG